MAGMVGISQNGKKMGVRHSENATRQPFLYVFQLGKISLNET